MAKSFSYSAIAHSERARTAISVIAFSLVAFALSYRAYSLLNIPRAKTWDRWAYLDFRHSVYYPPRALWEGGNPYDPAPFKAKYPVIVGLAPYSPLMLVLYMPFALLPYETAEVAYHLCGLATVLWLAHIALMGAGLRPHLATVFGTAAVVLTTRPGHWNLLLGQTAAALALAVHVALIYARSRPSLAGVAIAFASMKPTIGIPLVVLMTARRDWRALRIGVPIAFVATLLATSWVAANAGGVSAFIESLRRCWDHYATADPSNDPVLSPLRIDAVALVSRIAGHHLGLGLELCISLALLGVGAFAVHRLMRRQDQSSRDLSTALICITILLCTYHLAYAMLLLVLPVTALLVHDWRGSVRQSTKWILSILFFLMAYNYLCSNSAISLLGAHGALWVVIASINAVLLLLVLGVVLMKALEMSTERCRSPV